MNGPTRVVFDTCAAVFLIDKDKRMLALEEDLAEAEKYVSIITRMELYAKRDITVDELADVDSFFADVTVIPLNGIVEKTAIEIRGKSEPKIKLPDCIIAATAIALGATCLTSDYHLLNLVWPGYTVQTI
ncbi:MAG: PIN domain-containing protein [Spirochaetaceae bacterium]|jgi:predicted nucleic acid-binding protein|nr:PIN domain-containing protein [Spirochaetaceae bacterium]